MSKVRRSILIDVNDDKKVRQYQADAIKFSNQSVSYSEIINLLVEMTLSDKKKMSSIDNYFKNNRKKI